MSLRSLRIESPSSWNNGIVKVLARTRDVQSDFFSATHSASARETRELFREFPSHHSPTTSHYVQFYAREMAASAESPCSQHHAVGQQARRVLTARGVEVARARPGPARRVVQFRARESIEAANSSCCNQQTGGETGRRVVIAAGVEAARRRTGAAPRT